MLEKMKEQGENTKSEIGKWKSNANCRREGILYHVDCLTCKEYENPKESTYTGGIQ